MHGGPRSECGDTEKDWWPQHEVCLPAMYLAGAQRLYDEVHKERPWHDGFRRVWSKEFSRRTPYHYRDGVAIWLSPTNDTPDDDFLGQRS